MFYSDEFIFLHLQKTGGTHVVKLLEPHFALHKRGKHNGIVGGMERPYVLFGIRNPWDWYVSLWAYGCQQKGLLSSYLTSGRLHNASKLAGLHTKRPSSWPVAAKHLTALPGKSAKFWRDLYRDPDDAAAFRKWLIHIHRSPTSGQTGEDFSALPMSQTCGLMTARYLEVGSRVEDWQAHRGAIRSVEDATAYCAQHLAATHYVRTESLEEDVAAALQAMGREVSADSLRAGRTNRSSHHPSSYYYDDETIALVAARDRAVIEAHGYTFRD